MNEDNTPRYAECSHMLLQTLAESEFNGLSPMEHILAFNHCIGTVAAHVQRETDELVSRKEIHAFMQAAAPGTQVIDPDGPIVQWTPTTEARLPGCQNPNCNSTEQLHPNLLDPDGGPEGGKKTIYATCLTCNTPHIIYIMED